MFGRKSEPPTAAELERKADSLRPGAEPQPLEPEEVTGVIDLARERLQVAQDATSSTFEAATRRLREEAQRAVELARRLSTPPKP